MRKMQLGDLIEDSALTVSQYYYEYYERLDHVPLGSRSINVFRKAPYRCHILESQTIQNIENTPAAYATKKTQYLYEELKNSNFFFVVVENENDLDEFLIPNMIFVSVEEAIAYAKQYLLQITNSL